VSVHLWKCMHTHTTDVKCTGRFSVETPTRRKALELPLNARLVWITSRDRFQLTFLKSVSGSLFRKR